MRKSKRKKQPKLAFDLKEGKFEANQRGYGFVITEDFDVFVPPRQVGGAMHGDLVTVQVLQKTRGNFEGRIVKVNKRARDRIIGEVEKRKKRKFVIPTDNRIFYRLLLPKNERVREGTIVEAKIKNFPEKSRIIGGEVLRIIGQANDPNIQIEIILNEHQREESFPTGVIEEAKNAPLEVKEDDLAERKDYRTNFTVTIDGLDAKDFDDAVSLEKKGENYFLTVHIADVSHYVPFDSKLDREARKRGFSVYLVDRVIPMLPFELSNGICSLNPQVDRLTFSVEIEITPQGEILNYEFFPGVIRSNYRLSYEEVDKYFESSKFPSSELENFLTRLAELAEVLEKAALKKGRLNFETVEAKVILNSSKKPVEIKLRERTLATRLIEETMIVTNQVVAERLFNGKFPALYRVHEKPDEEDLIRLAEIFGELGLPVKGLVSGHSKAIQKLIELSRQREDKHLLNFLLLRSMKQARYSPHPERHFGLSLNRYLHFTSPIRRYPDLMVHRLLKKALWGKFDTQVAVWLRMLPSLAEEMSFLEREAEEMERESVKLKIAEYMKEYHLGDVFEGIISGVVAFGLFVELPNTAEGLVPIRTLDDDYYRFEEEKHQFRGERNGKIYRLGQKVKVKVVDVNVPEKKIEFALVQ